MSNTSTGVQLISTASIYILYISYTMFIAGFIGNTLIILVFTKLTLFRGNRCAFYLIMESIANNFMLLLYFPTQVAEQVLRVDVGNISPAFCKIKTLYGTPLRLLISYIICFEAFDQFLSTHHQFNYRQVSTLRLARYLIGICYCICFLQAIPYGVFSEIIPGSGCIIINKTVLQYYTYFHYIFLNGSIPLVVSSLFSLLAYRNVRRLIRLQIPVERRRLDRQLTAMIFARVIAFITILTIYTLFRLYTIIISTNSANTPDNAYQFASLIISSILLWTFSVGFCFRIFD
jgi:hypothetical protein